MRGPERQDESTLGDCGRRRLRASWIAGALLLGSSAAAGAQPAPTLALTWEAPPECPQRDAVEAVTRRWIAESAEPLDPRSVEIEGRVFRQGAVFVLDLELWSNGGRSHEQLRAQRCDTFANLVGLKVSLAAAPRDAHQPHPASRPRSAIPTAAATSPSPRDAAERAPASVVPGLRVVFGAGFGSLPGVAAHGALYGTLVVAPFRFELGARAGLPKQVRYPDESLGAELWLLAGVARACWSPLTDGVELPLCAGVELGVIHAQALGLERPSQEQSLWASALLGPALRFGLAGPVSVWLELEASVALVRTHYSLSGREPLFSSDRFGGRALAGFELSL
jgi:hypothetical protein